MAPARIAATASATEPLAVSIRIGSCGRRRRKLGDQRLRVVLRAPTVEQDRVELHPVLRAEHRDRGFAVGGEDRPPTAPRGDRRDQAALRGFVVDQHQEALAVARHPALLFACQSGVRL